jgi:hypothetical protein
MASFELATPSTQADHRAEQAYGEVRREIERRHTVSEPSQTSAGVYHPLHPILDHGAGVSRSDMAEGHKACDYDDGCINIYIYKYNVSSSGMISLQERVKYQK